MVDELVVDELSTICLVDRQRPRPKLDNVTFMLHGMSGMKSCITMQLVL